MSGWLERWRQNYAARGFISFLPGKGLYGKRSLFADLIFCYFFIKEKVMGLRAQERGKPSA
jgi:hypothetical protein